MGFHWDVADFLRNWCVSWWFWGIVYIFVGGFTRISWFLPSWKLIWNPQKCTVFGTCLFLVESIEYNWIFGFVVVFKRHKQNQSWLGQCMMDHQKERNHGFAHIDIDDHPTWKKGAKQINTSLFPGSSQKFSDQIILPRDHPKTPPGLVDRGRAWPRHQSTSLGSATCELLRCGVWEGGAMLDAMVDGKAE